MLVASSGASADRAKTPVELHRLGDSAALRAVWEAGPASVADDAGPRALVVGSLPMAHLVSRADTDDVPSARTLDRDFQTTTAGTVAVGNDAESYCGPVAHEIALTAGVYQMLGGWR